MVVFSLLSCQSHVNQGKNMCQRMWRMLMRQIVATIKMCIIVCMFYARVFTADDEASGWTAMITRACVLPHHRLIMFRYQNHGGNCIVRRVHSQTGNLQQSIIQITLSRLAGFDNHFQYVEYNEKIIKLVDWIHVWPMVLLLQYVLLEDLKPQHKGMSWVWFGLFEFILKDRGREL